MNPDYVASIGVNSGEVDWSQIKMARESQEPKQGFSLIGTLKRSLDYISPISSPLNPIRQSAELVGTSAIFGLVNTIPLVANTIADAVGGEGTMKYLDTLEGAAMLDKIYQTGTSYQDAYEESPVAIELGGAILGSIPGGVGATKLLSSPRLTAEVSNSLARLAAMESDHIIGRSAAWLGGMLATSPKTEILRKGYMSMMRDPGMVANLMSLDKLKYAMYAGGSAAWQAMVYETASTLTQLKNPTYSSVEDLGSFVKHIGTAGIFGFGLGGTLGTFLWKSEPFMLASDSAVPTTLRQIATGLGEARTAVNRTVDAAQKFKDIPSGSKLSAVLDDVKFSPEAIEDLTKSYLGFLPKSQHDEAVRVMTEWVTKRSDFVSSEIKSNVIELTKKYLPKQATAVDDVPAEGTIAETVLNKMVKGEEGKLLKSPEDYTQIFGEAVEIAPVKVVVTKKSDLGVHVIDDLPLATKEAFRDKLFESEIAERIQRAQAEVSNHFNVLKQAVPGANSSLTKDKVPEALHGTWKAWQEARVARNSIPGYKEFGDLFVDPKLLSKDLIKKFGLDENVFGDFMQQFSHGARKSSIHTYDTKLGRFTDRPVIQLGDLTAHKGSLAITGNTLTLDGKVLAANLPELTMSSSQPLGLIESQIRWQYGGRNLQAKSGNKLTYEGIPRYNPFRLAAAIDQDIPIFYGEHKVSRDFALKQLADEKKKLYKHAMENLKYADEEARLYADIPHDANLESWVPTKGRELNFLERRHVTIKYSSPNSLDEFQLKTIAGIRNLIYTKQLEVSEAAYQTAKLYGIQVPDMIKNALTDLREFGLNGATPLDHTSVSGSTAFTNASGRMFKMNTQANAIAAYLHGEIEKLNTSVARELSSDIRAILQAAPGESSREVMQLVHKKVHGGGTKWYDAADVVGDEAYRGYYISREWAKDLIKPSAEELSAAEKLEELLGAPMAEIAKNTFKVTDRNVLGFLTKYSKLEGIGRKVQLRTQAARGINVLDQIPGELYFPPLDITKSPYFVMVRDNADSAIGGFSRTSFVHANTEKALVERVNLLQREFGDRFEILRPQDIQLNKTLKGEFEYSRNFYSYSLDNELHSKGVFSEFAPRNVEEILEEAQAHLMRTNRRNMRMLLKDMTGDFIDSMHRLSDTLDPFTRSVHGTAGQKTFNRLASDNPYSRVVRTMLNIAPGEEAGGVLGAYSAIQNRFVTWVDDIATQTRNFYAATKMNSPHQERLAEEKLNRLIEESKKFGMDLSDMTLPILKDAELKYGKVAFSSGVVQKLNSLSYLFTLGIDTANFLVQSLSMPITINSAIRSMINDAPPEIANGLKNISVAGTAGRVASKATGDFFRDILEIRRFDKLRRGYTLDSDEASKLIKWLSSPRGKFFQEMDTNGLLPPSTRQLMIDVNDITNLSVINSEVLSSKLKRAAEIVSGPSRYAEVLQRYVSLKTAAAIADTLGLQGAQRLNMLHSFATQSGGVYTAAQRPGMFQGAIGGSIGLYKSYAINLMQAFGRHIEDRDIKGLLAIAATQGTIFGAKSVPGADAINQYIIKQSVEDQQDLFTLSDMIMGKDGANAMLYGLPSMFLHMNLYSRGDLRPTGVIGNPLDLASYPAANQLFQVGAAIAEAGSLIGNGAPVGNSLLQAAAHQSLSRPTARVSEYFLGYQTSKQGGVISPVKDNAEDLFKWRLLIRAAGAKPIDEAILSDAYYRETQYQRDRDADSKALRNATKNSIMGDGDLDMDGIIDHHLRNGGNVKDIRRWIRDQYKAVDHTGVDELRDKLIKSNRLRHAQQLDFGMED